MNRFGILLIGLVCLMFVFGGNEAYTEQDEPEIERVHSTSSTVQWDAPTTLANGKPIPPNYILKYRVFIDRDDDNTHKDKEPLTKEPIAENQFTLPPSLKLPKGNYYIGVQTLAYPKKGDTLGKPSVSDISWSSSKSKTNEKPFLIEVK